ncbi:ribosome maturation factor RimP [Acidaminobacterium chupaoyuni]
MQTKELLRRVAAMCEKPAAEAGVSIWDITFEKEGPRYLLTVTIDKDPAVDISECEAVSRAIDPLLDAPEFDSLPEYTLCVSSAGLERALRLPRHYQWAVGKEVEVTFYKPHNGKKAEIGVLEAFDGQTLTLNQTIFPLEEIASCRQHFDFTKMKDK